MKKTGKQAGKGASLLEKKSEMLYFFKQEASVHWLSCLLPPCTLPCQVECENGEVKGKNASDERTNDEPMVFWGSKQWGGVWITWFHRRFSWTVMEWASNSKILVLWWFFGVFFNYFFGGFFELLLKMCCYCISIVLRKISCFYTTLNTNLSEWMRSFFDLKSFYKSLKKSVSGESKSVLNWSLMLIGRDFVCDFRTQFCSR